MAVYGYARVSSGSQSHEAQCEALRGAGCEKIYAEKISAKAEVHRPQLAKLLRVADAGDVIIVCKLDRFARSLRDCSTSWLIYQRGMSAFDRCAIASTPPQQQGGWYSA